MIDDQRDVRVGFWMFLIHLGHLTLSSKSVFFHVAYDHTELLPSVHQILVLGNSEHPLLHMCRLDTATSDNIYVSNN